jgi:hypothetical protein
MQPTAFICPTTVAIEVKEFISATLASLLDRLAEGHRLATEISVEGPNWGAF